MLALLASLLGKRSSALQASLIKIGRGGAVGGFDFPKLVPHNFGHLASSDSKKPENILRISIRIEDTHFFEL